MGRGADGRSEKLWRAHRRVLDHARKIGTLVHSIGEFRPHIVHLHGPLGKLDFSYYRLLKRHGARVVYTAYDLTPAVRLDSFNRMRYRAADLILVHSLNSIADLRNYGVEESRIVQIPHVSLSPLARNGMLPREEAKASLGLPSGARVLLFFGRIEPRKGLDLLIDAHARLIREHSQIYLIIAGEPSGEFTGYRKRIVESGVSERVILDLRYIPFDRMKVYFSAADAVVLPYRRIYQSGVLQLAYAFGRPVVVTDIGGIREAVAADGTGVIAAPDAEALARAILRLLTDQELARAMGDQGLLVARTKYSWEAVSEKVIRIYRELLGMSSIGQVGLN
jgi:glycosyltransferase involved in cell wall biosynthesis